MLRWYVLYNPTFAANCRSQGGHVKAKGTIYLSNIRMVFVANKPVGNFYAFDMPLVSEYYYLIIIAVCFVLEILMKISKEPLRFPSQIILVGCYKLSSNCWVFSCLKYLALLYFSLSLSKLAA